MKLTAPKAGENVSLLVAVRVRPVLNSEQPKNKDAQTKDILRVIDKRMVLVMDPEEPEEKDYLDQVQNRSKEKKYTFDVAFGAESTNSKLYKATIAPLIKHVISGHNCTVFAYGATGSGKTYTMVGSHADSGLMVRSMESLFAQSAQLHKDEDVTITASYLEVYNEVLYDLLVPNSAELPLREDPVLGAVPSGLTFAQVSSASDILHLLEAGNARRKTERTDANTQSSRSHAVLEVHLKRQGRNHYKSRHLVGKLALVDLAGSERAAETNNFGQKLRDGANINRSLLSLANCINQLGKAGASGGRAYIPYRNSKLTRLLKDGLSGNSRTVMIATVAASADQYHHSINTLKYANRAKDIKTHIVQNVGSVESHISDYRRIIDNLQGEVRHLKEQLALQEESRSPSVAGTDPTMCNPEGVSLVDTLVSSIHNNVAERINLQKALFEVQDADVRTRMQLEALQSSLKGKSGYVDDAAKAEAEELSQRIKDNEAEIAVLRGAIDANEKAQQSVHARIDGTIEGQGNRNPQLLKILKQFRLQALQLVELEFQMAVRDQIIDEQRTVVGNLWKVLGELAPSEHISDIASELGIAVDDATEGTGTVQVPSFASGCMAAVAAAAAAVTSAGSGSRPSLNTLQPVTSARPSVGIPSSTTLQARNRSSSPTPTSHISLHNAAVLASNAINTASISDTSGSTRNCVEPAADAQTKTQEGLHLQGSRSLPAPHGTGTNASKLEDDCDAPALLTSLSAGAAPPGSSKFPGIALGSSIPEHSVPCIEDRSSPTAVKGKSPTAWGEPVSASSLTTDKAHSNQLQSQSANTAATKGDANNTSSTDNTLGHSIGVQGMRVLSSLKVAGWSLAGGGGARSAHIMREDRDAQSKQKAGGSKEPSDSLGAASRAPIRGWGALDDISSASQSPVRTSDHDASQASRSILTGICGRAAGSMRAARSSVDDESDVRAAGPTDGQEAWIDDSPTDTKRCTSFSFRSRQANSLRAKLTSPQGKCAGTSKARSSGASSRTSLGLRLLGSLRSTRPSRRNSMCGTSTSTDGPPRTASGGGELEVGGGAAAARGGLGDTTATSSTATANGTAAAAAAGLDPPADEAPVSRGSGGASRDSDRVMPFSSKQDVDSLPDVDAPVATRAGIPQTDLRSSKQFPIDAPLQDRLTAASVSGLRLQGTSPEGPAAIHAWTGPTSNPSTNRILDTSAAASGCLSKSKPSAEMPTAAVNSTAAGAAAQKAAAAEPWESGFKERRRVVGGSVAAVLGTSAFPTTFGGASTCPGSGAATAVAPSPAATATGTFPQFGSGLPGDLSVSKDVGGLAGGSLPSMAPTDRLKRLKSHRDRSARVSVTKQVSDAKLKEFAMEVVGGGVQGASSKIKP